MSDETAALVRSGFLAMIEDSLGEVEFQRNATAASLAVELEEACYNTYIDGVDPSIDDYVQVIGSTCQLLRARCGDFREITYAGRMASGEIKASEMISMAQSGEELRESLSISPRTIQKAEFYSIFEKDDRFDGDAKKRNALEIEKSCYNESIAHCALSEDAYSRSWDSPMFVAIYSARCGSVIANLSPDGSVSKSFGGSWALDRLADETWSANDLGRMSEAELCPEAGRKEREEVERRLAQKITEKTSSMFKCPRCKKNNHTYRQVQIRSADEPASFMCTCKECGQNFEGFG